MKQVAILEEMFDTIQKFHNQNQSKSKSHNQTETKRLPGEIMSLSGEEVIFYEIWTAFGNN